MGNSLSYNENPHYNGKQYKLQWEAIRVTMGNSIMMGSSKSYNGKQHYDGKQEELKYETAL